MSCEVPPSPLLPPRRERFSWKPLQLSLKTVFASSRDVPWQTPRGPANISPSGIKSKRFQFYLSKNKAFFGKATVDNLRQDGHTFRNYVEKCYYCDTVLQLIICLLFTSQSDFGYSWQGLFLIWLFIAPRSLIAQVSNILSKY